MQNQDELWYNWNGKPLLILSAWITIDMKQITNVVYSNIKLSGITVYGIDVQQDYLNGGPTGSPTNGVEIHRHMHKLRN